MVVGYCSSIMVDRQLGKPAGKLKYYNGYKIMVAFLDFDAKLFLTLASTGMYIHIMVMW